MIDNSIYIYNTNIDSIDIKVIDSNINIYSLYITINNYIKDIKKKLKTAYKELDIKKGGPKDVQAITYDRPAVMSSMRIEDINEIYKQVSKIVDTINDLKSQLSNLIKSKKKLEETIREVAKVRKDNLEIKVFIGRYIDKKTLKQLSLELKREDAWGRIISYSYQYLREVNVKIKKKMEENAKNLQFWFGNLHTVEL